MQTSHFAPLLPPGGKPGISYRHLLCSATDGSRFLAGQPGLRQFTRPGLSPLKEELPESKTDFGILYLIGEHTLSFYISS
jgi:hypothetical protein